MLNQDDNPAMLVFSGPLVRQLSTKAGRLEPTYVGVRRVRPSSRMVQKAFQTKTKQEEITTTEKQTTSDVTFKIVGDDGVERRMTNQEKKALKKKLRGEKAKAKKQERLEKVQQKEEEEKAKKKRKRRNKKRSRNEMNGDTTKETAESKLATASTTSEQEEAAGTTRETKDQKIEEKVLHDKTQNDETEDVLSIDGQMDDFSRIQQEIADLKGERQGVPPVMLSPPLAQVSGTILSDLKYPYKSEEIVYMNDTLAQDWSVALRQSMHPSEKTRNMEEMRALVYNLIPEIWSRFRPASLVDGSKTKMKSDITFSAMANQKADGKDNLSEAPEEEEEKPWRLLPIRHRSVQSTFDDDLAAVVKVLYENTSLHISCGAKFGCDLLLYDGPRNERHAFAGLRLVTGSSIAMTTNGESFPLLSAYCLAGYVRCLNTAAKLALLATVKREKLADGSTLRKVAFVDLKLERVDGTKKRDLEERMGNLQKVPVA